jgi:hypothetical protein
MFYVVERSILVVKPKQALLDWINETINSSEENFLTLDAIRIDCNSYLIPEVNEIEEGIAYVDEIYEALFQLELSSWSENQDLWPQDLTLKMFWEWFDIEISPTLIDLSEDDEVEQKKIIELPETIH